VDAAGWLRLIAVTELVCALPWHGIYLLGYRLMSHPQAAAVDPLLVALSAEGLLFLLAPLAGVYGAFRNRPWVTFPLALFPVLAFAHGVSAIPYLARLAPVGHWRTLALVVINGGLIVAVLVLRTKSVKAVV
jgi:hypothetical protein